MEPKHNEPASHARLEVDGISNPFGDDSITLLPEDCDKFTRMIEDGLLAPLYAHETAVQGNFALTLGNVVVVDAVNSSPDPLRSTE